MTDALLLFTGGLAGSGHCLGMCGPFALALGVTPGGRRWLRHLVYGLGRVFTYVVAGSVAGYAGLRLQSSLPATYSLQAAIAILAGLVLTWQGAKAAGLPLPAFTFWRQPGCPNQSFLGALLRATRLRSVFLGGMVNGLIPCGLTYAYLALAMATQRPLEGGAAMLLFGLGTLPALILLGVGSSWLAPHSQRRLQQLGAWCVVLTGVMILIRATYFLTQPTGTEGAACPFCIAPW